MENYLWLTALGIVLGAVGTLIGAGGGFVLAPVLLLLYPHDSPATIASISLAVVFFNALSGSLAYARMSRIDYRSGLLFAAATIPGAIAGALTTDYIPRHTFDGAFGILLIMAAGYLIFHRNEEKTTKEIIGKHHATRKLIDRNGTVHIFHYDLRIGVGLSVAAGYISSFFGIGGGFIHVPALVRLLNFPVHFATATSQFILAIMALTGTIVHIADGSFAHGGMYRTIFLGAGALLGAQAGAWLSSRVHGVWIIRVLAIALGFVGIRILIMALKP
jgi:uncharacterized protein